MFKTYVFISFLILNGCAFTPLEWSKIEGFTLRSFTIAQINLKSLHNFNDKPYTTFFPGDITPSFRLPVQHGWLDLPLKYGNESIVFALSMKKSGFTQCLFDCSDSVKNFLSIFPKETHFVFLNDFSYASSYSVSLKQKFIDYAR